MLFPLLTVPSYPKSGGLKREYGRRDEVPPPRSRAPVDYGPRVVPERRQSYRDEYQPRGSGYSDLPRSSTSRPAARRPYVDDGYGQRFERPPPSYREPRARDYDSVSGSKRPYSAVVSFTVCQVLYIFHPLVNFIQLFITHACTNLILG